jgi:hypothetical protein
MMIRKNIKIGIAIGVIIVTTGGYLVVNQAIRQNDIKNFAREIVPALIADSQSVSRLQVGEPTPVPNNPDLVEIRVVAALATTSGHQGRIAQQWDRTLTIRKMGKPSIVFPRGMLVTEIKDENNDKGRDH